MSIRVGRIMRHEDVHGVSGTGEHIAEVIEFSDGSAVVRWLGKDAMTNVAAGIKNVTNVHGHGGKAEIEWLWEQEAPPDPMDAVFEKKILEAGGSVANGKNGNGNGSTEAEKDAEADAIADEIVEDAAETVERVAEKVAEKLAAKTVEKVAQKTAEKKIAEKEENASE